MEMYIHRIQRNGNSHVSWHLVWDPEIFLAARQAEAEANASKGDDPGAIVLCERTDIEHYRRDHGYKVTK